MQRRVEIEITTSLAADPEAVWQSVSNMHGVNYELHPFLHMTSPRNARALPTAPRPGQVAFRSWLLLFGVLPFDRHSLALDEVERGRGFIEESSTWLHRRWRHERSLSPLPHGGCTVSDRLLVEPRVPPIGPVVAGIVGRLFAHRHRRLTKRFGAATAADGTEPVTGPQGHA
ncbi:MAG: hypothetical protein R2754_14805 [Microthrixaceae bacterium]